MAKTWRRAIQKYRSLGAISFEKAFSTIVRYLRYIIISENSNQRSDKISDLARRLNKHLMSSSKCDFASCLP
jgi:hypothetical protein